MCLYAAKGVITFVVPYEFEVKLSIVSDDLNTPWRLISLKILVGEGLPGECSRAPYLLLYIMFIYFCSDISVAPVDMNW